MKRQSSSVRKAANRRASGIESGLLPGRGSSSVKASVPSSAPADLFLSKRFLLACLILIAAIAAVYAPVRHFGFLSWDDPDYVTGNSHVAQGLTWSGAWWAFTSTTAANWHPLTWLSHMLDVQLFGMDAGAHHVTNLLIHTLNTLLLFGLLCMTTGAFGRSLFVAALFALHPLHVESVAWIAERKDVLSTLFWLLTVWSYVAYVRRPRPGRRLVVLLSFALGLMAKPMLVTLPFTLLLMDFWPLRRMEPAGADHAGQAAPARPWHDAVRLVREKLPLFALAAIASAVTFLAHRQGGAVAALEGAPLGLRVTNAAASYLAYIGKALWPSGLAAFYPLGASTAALQASLGAALLIVVTILTVRAGRNRGYLPVGWLWYVGTLVPVIGLVQVGGQSMADRYTYVPLIGLFLIAAWGAPELASRLRYGKLALPVAASCAILACGVLARAQVRYWSDDLSLWRHALNVTQDNYMAHTHLGLALANQGRDGEAMPHFVEAVRLRPDFALAQNDLGVALMARGDLDEAARHLSAALRKEPGNATIHTNLGLTLMGLGEPGEAARSFAAALELQPDRADAHANLGDALARIPGRLPDAVAQYREALRLQPGFPPARQALDRLETAPH
jgi:protein O-mannosyl-transferase